MLASGLDGVYWPLEDTENEADEVEISTPYEGWDADVRPLLEHAVVYAACKSGDEESLAVARAICSEGVTLRPNSPEQWWRYSIVLGLLGDQVASEDALQASIAFGGGQGVRGDM
uniref:Tetratricopeptide repeat protein 38 n=1 Tax=Craspedostauros australis TaxID=1486917 RepID=A0A7S0F6R0_9STRA